MTKMYSVGGFRFGTQGEVVEKVHEIERRYEDQMPLMDEDFQFMLSLIQCRPDFSTKCPEPIETLCFGVAPYNASNRCLYFRPAPPERSYIGWKDALAHLPEVDVDE